VLIGAASMALMAVSIVMVKRQLEVLPVVLATSIRLVGGLAILGVVGLCHAPTRRELRATLSPQPAWRHALPGSVLGAYLALILWIGGFKYTSASLASILNQTSALYIVVLGAIFLREELRPAHVAALAMALSGSVLVLW
jgi:drug/metabolite transporter (DMT)-like permease